jgi:hypothetical protein
VLCAVADPAQAAPVLKQAWVSHREVIVSRAATRSLSAIKGGKQAGNWWACRRIAAPPDNGARAARFPLLRYDVPDLKPANRSLFRTAGQGIPAPTTVNGYVHS